MVQPGLRGATVSVLHLWRGCRKHGGMRPGVYLDLHHRYYHLDEADRSRLRALNYTEEELLGLLRLQAFKSLVLSVRQCEHEDFCAKKHPYTKLLRLLAMCDDVSRTEVGTTDEELRRWHERWQEDLANFNARSRLKRRVVQSQAWNVVRIT